MPIKPRRLLLLGIALIYIAGFFVIDRWKTTLYYGDSNGYYLHVVSFLLYHDVGDYDQSIGRLREVNPGSPDPREDPYGIRLTSKGRRYIKYTLGVPLMEAPFFLMAHVWVTLSGVYPADGWSKPYLLAVGFSTIFYILIGFYLLIRVLEKQFPMRIITYVVLALALATNLFYHATYVTMAHGFLFFAHCLLIYLSASFYHRPSTRNAFVIGLVVGLIALTRVPEVISALIPLFWGLKNRQDLNARFRYFIEKPQLLLAAAVGFSVLFSLQLIYWYYVSGQLLFNPYQGEAFDFLRPRIHKGWFHFSNGWLIYSPIMGFSLLGLLVLRRYFSEPLLPIISFVGLHAYIHYSYYAWTYFPGLGSRPMVETYPLLSFGLAASFMFLSRKKYLAWIPVVALIFFSWLNLFQTWQIRKGIIWSERGSWAFYYESFGKLTFSLEALRAFDTNQIQPDSSQLRLVHTILSEGFEDWTGPGSDSSRAYEGHFSLLPPQGECIVNQALPLRGDVQGGDWIRVGLFAYMPAAYQIWNRDHTAMLFFELYDEKGKKKKGANLRISSHIGNAQHSIWSAGEVGQWGEAAFFIKVPRSIRKGWYLRSFIKNPNGQKLFLDAFKIDHYKVE